ncbi:hypothetical protein [Leisingera sp. ANG-M7]|uniref:hypothetical protein n=1 Tax=Leisingera sp. ANG-M7 TaxID=1577902 RepID=UPI0019D3AD7A|nr:hypothetical protein [Leisingera sp. ANG-M7]
MRHLNSVSTAAAASSASKTKAFGSFFAEMHKIQICDIKSAKIPENFICAPLTVHVLSGLSGL